MDTPQFPRNKRWARVSASANLEYDFKLKTRDPKKHTLMYAHADYPMNGVTMKMKSRARRKRSLMNLVHVASLAYASSRQKNIRNTN